MRIRPPGKHESPVQSFAEHEPCSQPIHSRRETIIPTPSNLLPILGVSNLDQRSGRLEPKSLGKYITLCLRRVQGGRIRVARPVRLAMVPEYAARRA